MSHGPCAKGLREEIRTRLKTEISGRAETIIEL